jgi:Kef-type K+ transport system membrane component KefB
MPAVSFTNLLIICAVAVLAPLLLGLLPRLRVPAVVLEIVAGIVLGPSVLGWVHVDLPVQILALFGLAFLLFLAGLEIDLSRLRGRVLRLALLGYAVTLGLGLLAGTGFAAAGWVGQPLLLAIALSATSLGLIVPVLKDAGTLARDVGQTAIAAATVADFAAIVLLSLFFSTSGGGTGAKLILLVAFVAVVTATAFTIVVARRSMRLGDVLSRLQDTTAETGSGAPSCCWSRSPSSPNGSAWKPSSAPSWPGRWLGWSTGTPHPTRTSEPSSRPSATASSSRSSSSAAASGWT